MVIDTTYSKNLYIRYQRFCQINFIIFILRVLEGGFAGAAVLISFGVILGKVNPLQLLVMAIIETALYVANLLIGSHLLNAIDIGKHFYNIQPQEHFFTSIAPGNCKGA